MATVSLQTAYDQARRLLESGDADRAEAVAQHILRSFPRNLEAHRLLGEAYLAERHFEQAEDAFQTVLHADPENIPAYVGLGVANERLGNTDQAIEAFEHALEIKPDMAELRSQLLRLYTDSWGSDRAQLRLSRVGLARLYAKGHMQPQAIQEFRSVIAEQPERFDARVALAEVLWRDGQEDATVTTCEDILQERPEVLKANLLLGYIYLAAGDPVGDQYWKTGLELDPYQVTARSLFDHLPNDNEPEPTLPVWDEQAWLDERNAQRQREETPAEVPTEPVAAAVETPADDLFAGSWLDTIGQEPATPVSSEYETVQADEEPDAADDDFLARLLAFESLPDVALDDDYDDSHATSDTPATHDAAATQQFSLAELGLSDEESAPPIPTDDSSVAATAASHDAHDEAQEPLAPPPVPDLDAPELTPFSLSDLGLSEDEIAAFSVPPEEAHEPEPQSGTTTTDEPDMTPFSLSDLGLSEDEIAAFSEPPVSETAALEEQHDASVSAESPTASASQEPATQSETSPSDEPELTPFSLSDLGLSDDEIAAFDFDTGALSDSETNTSAQEHNDAEIPFSLDDTDAQAESNDALTSGQTGNETETTGTNALSGVKPFSMDDWSFDEPVTEGSATTSADSADDFDVSDDLLPFSFDDLDMNEASSGDDSDLGELPPSLQPFALEDVGETPAPSSTSFRMSNTDEPDTETSGYSFRQAPAKRTTDFGRDTDEQPQEEGTSIFAKLRQRRNEIPAEEPPPLLPVADDETDMSLFSHDDISLRDDGDDTDQHVPTPVVETPSAQPLDQGDSQENEPELTPFSLSDLGLSDEEIASLNLDQSETRKEAPSAASAPVSDSTEPDLTPFSLSDLGLSPDEIASLGLDDSPATAASAEPDLTPFSLSDLGLSDDEIASLGMEGSSAGQTSQTQDQPELATQDADDSLDFALLDASPSLDEGAYRQEDAIEAELQPFSLDDLGLSDADFSGYGLGEAGSELGLTEEELATMDLGALEKSGTPSTPAAQESDDYGVDTGDPVLDHLITLGRRQGFVDLTDIISAVTNPEEEAERIEEIGQVLHRAGVQIRDGDEIIDMDEMEAEGEDAFATYAEHTEAEPAITSDTIDEGEADLTPFSLSDLGLSPEEIASLGLDEASVSETPAATSGEPTSDEPELTPFSLSDLGLSPEEIASLGLDESAASETPATTTSEAPASGSAADEPELMPFSLSELGLSPEEIASLDQADVAPVTEDQQAQTSTSATADEPELTPFSLSDLGLSPEEIASLSLPDEGATSAESLSSLSASETTAGEDNDVFDFSAADEAPRQTIASTPRPRVEEPAPLQSPEDAAFVPESLDTIDSIWDAVPAQSSSSTPAAPPAASAASAPEPVAPAATSTTPAPVAPTEQPVEQAQPAPQPEAPARATTRPPHIETITRPVRSEPAPARPPVSRESAPAAPAQPSAPQPEHTPRTESPRPARTSAPGGRLTQATFTPTGDETLDTYLRQLETEPDNHPLRLALARLSGQTGRLDLAMQQYRALTKSGSTLDQVEDDLHELIDEVDDPKALQRLYRILGDVYTKKNRFRDAVEAYSWTFGK